MRVTDTFMIEGRGCVITVKGGDMPDPTNIGDIFQLEGRRWKLVGVEHIRYGCFGPPPPVGARDVGLLLQEEPGTSGWPSKDDDLTRV